LSSVTRFLAAHGYDRRSLKAGRLESGPTKAFEAPAPNDLWMVDFACGPTLRTPAGRAITTHLCVILDDHSRLIAYGSYYLAGDTASFLDCLKQAVLRRGLPLKLYTDQGKPFVNHHVRIVCANLGIRLLHAKPYHAWSKGKVERLIRTIQGDFEATLRLEGNHVHSVAELNTAFSRWVAATYHLRAHGSTGMSPHERFTRADHPLRTVEEPNKIDALFYTHTERVVRKDGTVTLGKNLLEVNLALRALKVELRYDPVLFDRVEVWHKGSCHGLARPADLHLNSQLQHRSDNYAR
jgi:transposase InsO family protein